MKISFLTFFLGIAWAQLYNVTTLITGLNNPTGVAVNPFGRVLVVNTGTNQTFHVSAPWDSIDVHLSSLADPFGVAIDSTGDFYILAESGSNKIIYVSANSTILKTFGSGISGNLDGSVDFAEFSFPSGVAIGMDGKIYVADTNNHRVRIIDTILNTTTTLAGSSQGYGIGTGSAALLSYPSGLVVDSMGNLFIADSGNNAIRKISISGDLGTVSNFAGGSSAGYLDGNGITARFNNPRGISIDSKDNLYVADTGNNAIRKISPDGFVFTLSGNGSIGRNNGLASYATFSSPIGISVSQLGELFISDSGNNLLRKLEYLPYSITEIIGSPSTEGFQQISIIVRNFNVTNILQALIRNDLNSFNRTITGCTVNFNISYSNITCMAPSVPYYGPFQIFLQIQDNLGEIVNTTYSDLYYQTPTVTSISPNTTDTAGNTVVSIIGRNFGNGCCQNVAPVINFGSKSCRNASRINDNLIICTIPEGVGKFYPTVILNGVNLNNTIQFAYFPPIISSINPSVTFSASVLKINGSQFGTTQSLVTVKLTNIESSQSFNCFDVILESSTRISCRIPPALPVGNFSVNVIAQNQESSILFYARNSLLPIITSVVPSEGSPIGNTSITIQVENLAGSAEISFIKEVNETYSKIMPINCNQVEAKILECVTPSVPFSETYSIGVKNGGISGPLDSATFTYFPPEVFSISPRSGDNLGGFQLEIVGKNFGEGPVELFIGLGDYPCLRPTRVDDNLLVCSVPEGVGSSIPTILIGPVNVAHNSVFSYFPPIISYISPTTVYLSSQLVVSGANFGSFRNEILIDLTSGSNTTSCFEPRWQSPNNVICKVPPNIELGEYVLTIMVGNQKSDISDPFLILPPPPPVAYNVNAFSMQTTVPIALLITLNVSSIFLSATSVIKSLPANGFLFQVAEEGGRGSEIRQAGVNVIGGVVYYIPRQFFSGNDSFTYYARDPAQSNDASVDITIGFVNQAPSFPNPVLTVPMNESFSTYSIDLFSLIFDPDEYSNYTLRFDTKPTRGKWAFDGVPIAAFDDLLLIEGNPNVLQVEYDEYGGRKPYFDFTASVFDSYGNVSSNQILVTGEVTCNILNALNIWGTGKVCIPCPTGAICSPTGDFPITNQFGYYGILVTLSENNQSTVLFLECTPPEACPADRYKFGQQTCAKGYTNSRCGTCDNGYYIYGNTCNECPNVDIPPVVLVLLAFLILSIVLYLAYRMSKMDVGFIGVIYTYFQAISAFYGLKLAWPPVVVNFLGFLSIFSLNIDVVSPECFRVTSPSESFDFKYYATLATPAAIVGTAVILYSVYYVVDYVQSLLFPKPRSVVAKSGLSKRVPTMLSQLLAAILLAMKFLFLTLANTILSIYNCTYEAVNDKYFFEPAPSRFCYIQQWWWDLLPSSIIAFMVYIVGTISLSSYVDAKAGKIRQDRINEVKDAKVAEMLTSPVDMLLMDMTQTEFPVYKPEYLYWDAVVMCRKLLIGIIINFMAQTPQTQCVLLIVIFQFSLVLQHKRKPYFKDNINDLEEVTLMSASIVLLIGLVTAAQERDDPVYIFLLGVTIILFICGSGIFMFWNIIYHYYLSMQEVKRLTKKKLRQSFMPSKQDTSVDRRSERFSAFDKSSDPLVKPSKTEKTLSKLSKIFRQPPTSIIAAPSEPVLFTTEALAVEKTPHLVAGSSRSPKNDSNRQSNRPEDNDFMVVDSENDLDRIVIKKTSELQ